MSDTTPLNGNVVTACKSCNIAKSDLSRDEFMSLVRRIAEHNHLIEMRV